MVIHSSELLIFVVMDGQSILDPYTWLTIQQPVENVLSDRERHRAR